MVNIKYRKSLKDKDMLNKKIFTSLGLVLLGASVVACSAPASNTQASNTQAPAQSVAANAAIASGTFSGRSDHITTGQVTLEETNAGYQLSFASDFSLDGAPDPVVALGNGGVYVKANKLGKLKNKTGRQTYALPASFKPGQFSEVYVWCEEFDVPLGIANLSSN